ncbi:hypothetical protein IQ07DRAFT_254959 [Pyrenochaeta sp. DS3sAY3a]|nr:hypothetical protein IQ07DRAFT_254959 [Pyrenochaeta sp. DS3sAY3a]
MDFGLCSHSRFSRISYLKTLINYFPIVFCLLVRQVASCIHYTIVMCHRDDIRVSTASSPSSHNLQVDNQLERAPSISTTTATLLNSQPPQYWIY